VRASRTREENVIIVIMEGEGVSNESASKATACGGEEKVEKGEG